LANNAIRNAHKLFKHKPSAFAVCELQDKTKFKTPLVTISHEVFSSEQPLEKSVHSQYLGHRDTFTV